MALTTNREIFFGSPIEKVEHLTGKTVLSWRRDMNRFGYTVFFTDKTMCLIDEGAPFDWEKAEYLRIPSSICTSCGQDAHVSYWNWKGQCVATVKNFWLKARKVFWHRYQKTGHL